MVVRKMIGIMLTMFMVEMVMKVMGVVLWHVHAHMCTRGHKLRRHGAVGNLDSWGPV